MNPEPHAVRVVFNNHTKASHGNLAEIHRINSAENDNGPHLHLQSVMQLLDSGASFRAVLSRTDGDQCDICVTQPALS
jgi:hypothetical protein